MKFNAFKTAVKFPALLIVAGLLTVSTTHAQSQSKSQTLMPQAQMQPKLAYDGNCSVCLVKYQKWVPGNPAINSKYDGLTYYFPDASTKQAFDADPAAYAPVLGGDCTVCLVKIGKRVPGSINFASLYKDRVYLFPEAKQKEMFEAAPEQFVNVDLAANGNCIVCAVKANKQVPGKVEFTAIHDGMRYLFPSDDARQIFIAAPNKFLAPAKPQMSANEVSQPTAIAQVQAQLVTVQGTTSCAGCNYGVKPIGAPDELGLAVVDADGTVYVIEESHTRWPERYKARFNGEQVSVTGTVIKAEGKVVWVQPSSLHTL